MNTMSSLMEEENNRVQRFSGEYLVMDGLKEFHVSRYNPITQEFEPYGVYGDHTNFEKRHRIIGSRHKFDEDVFLYFTINGGYEDV